VYSTYGGTGGGGSDESSKESAEAGGKDYWLPFLLKNGANSIATCRTLIPTGIIVILTPRVHYLNSHIVTIPILPLEQGNPDSQNWFEGVGSWILLGDSCGKHLCFVEFIDLDPSDELSERRYVTS
jgi:hypothetical protein